MRTASKSKYDFLFKHNVENHIKNIIVYKKDDNWSISQNYNKLDPSEHLIWSKLFSKVYKIAYNNSINIFKEGIDCLSNRIDDFSLMMPNLYKVSDAIKSRTGWQIKVVSGFVDEVIFFDLLSNKFFPSSDIIRLSDRFYNKYKNTNVKNDLSYTPEPDIFHEIFGHAPFLFNKDYCVLLESIGHLGCEILNSNDLDDDLKSHNLKRLQNFVWWTLEFGLVRSNNSLGYEIYGAGILSSYDEIVNSLKNRNNVIEYNFDDIIMTRFDYSELQDRYYLIDSFEFLVEDFLTNRDKFFYKG